MAKKRTSGLANRPIGVFDSGIGGLTVANAIQKVLPNESLVYFGDTAHLPYGDKSPDSIKYYAIRISQFLLKQQCKMIVIACNTASAMAYETVKDFVGDAVPVIDVINPVVEHVTGIAGSERRERSKATSTRRRSTQRTRNSKSLRWPLPCSLR